MEGEWVRATGESQLCGPLGPLSRTSNKEGAVWVVGWCQALAVRMPWQVGHAPNAVVVVACVRMPMRAVVVG